MSTWRPVVRAILSAAAGAVATLPSGCTASRPQLLPTVAPGTVVQALGGVGIFGGDLRAERTSSTGEQVTADASTQLTLGIAGHRPFGRTESAHWGFDAGFLWSHRRDASEVRAPGGPATVRAELSFAMFEVFFGLYGSINPLPRLRVYAGAGPDLVAARLRVEDLDVQRDDTEFALGAAARVGIEWEVSRQSMLGLSARAMTADLDFDAGVGERTVDGVQLLLTYSREF